jgi:putative DNA primase/helicase
MNRFADRGEWMRRTGQAPKTGFLFRLPDAIKKTEVAVAPTGHAPQGKAEKVEVLCDGQQFIAFGIHPDTRQPYHWHALDPRDGRLGVHAMLPEISEPELRDFLSWVANAYGPEEPAQSLAGRATAAISAPTGAVQPMHRTGDSAPFWRAVNDAALADLDAWVPALLPKAKKQSTGAWRVSSRDLGRNLEEDLSIHPNGIQDFGQEKGLTAIDVVRRFQGSAARDAAMWLCNRLGLDPASLGWTEQLQASSSGHHSAPEGQEPRCFEKLLEASRALGPGQIEDIEAIVAETVGLTPMRRETIFRAIKDATGVSLGTIRAQLSQERDAIPERDHLDLARMTLDDIGRKNVIFADGVVWRWQARGVWTEQDDRAIKQAVQVRLDAEHMINVTAALVNGVTDVFKSEIYREEHKFNCGRPETVNCLNGELVLDEFVGWHLEPHCRENYRTTQIPVEYDPRADAPMFRAFLEQVFRDDPDRDDKISAVLELMGYTLMSHARHEKFVMLIGPGANGKSVLLSVLEGLLGSENVAGVQPGNFDNRFQRAHLHQKLANIVTELKQGEVIADAELKAITSGEPATVEHKHRNPFVMRPFATCWFGTNHMPHTRDFSEALFRRATILQFNRTFAKEEQDPKLKDKLKAELPGILKVCLDAYDRAVCDGFTEPRSSEDAKKEWRLEADQVALFVDEACHRGADARTPAGDVFQAYQSWAAENGISRTMSQKGLRDRLTRLGFGAERDRAARYVTGIRLERPAWAL